MRRIDPEAWALLGPVLSLSPYRTANCALSFPVDGRGYVVFLIRANNQLCLKFDFGSTVAFRPPPVKSCWPLAESLERGARGQCIPPKVYLSMMTTPNAMLKLPIS